ncbi:MAG TPA: S9 family peptidase [Phnomibacter sp.]|nr:S9 family peptidase [Phnomibacter sp.]
MNFFATPRFRCLLLAAGYCFISMVASAQTSPVLVTDLLKIKQIGNVDLSSDGSFVVFTVSGAIPDEKNKWEFGNQTQIWMLNLNGTAQPALLTGSRESASQPAISPDGNTLAFVRSVDQKPQIFLMNLKAPGEPVQLTTMANGAGSPAWSANGKSILFNSSYLLQDAVKDSLLNPTKAVPAWSLEKPGFAANQQLLATAKSLNPDGSLEEIRAYLEQNEKDSKAKVINKLNFQQEATTSGQVNINYAFIVDAVVGAKPRPVMQGLVSVSNMQFVGNTADYIFESANNLSLHPDRAQIETAIYRKSSGSALPQKIWGTTDSSFGGSSISPAGNWMAFTYGAPSFAGVRKLAITRLSQTAERITIPIDRSVNNMVWTADESALYFTASSNGGVVLYRYTLATKKLDPLTTFNEGIGSFDLEAGKLVFVKTEVANPFELYTAGADAKNQQRVSSFNYNWVKEKQISMPEKRSFKNEKGLEVEYWVMKPANWQQGKKYPTILEIHGGPTAMWGPGETSMWHEFQYYCAKGYAVVYANPRGSGGYGDAFLKANVNDWGNGPMSDVLTALNKSAGEFSWIDTSKLAVTGGSYAGYLIAYILGHDHRFKVACAQRGVYDLRTFFGEGNAWRLVPSYFGGYPWEKKTYDILERESPINYVQNVTTPLIIFHGENDLRTGVIQSEQFYRSLKMLGRQVEYVRHPGATHEITRSGNNRQRIDQMLRTYEFFERFIQH